MIQDGTEEQDQLPEGFQRVDSSNLKAVAFFSNPTDQPSIFPGNELGTVEVIFHNGLRWKYEDVPRGTFDDMLGSESVGKAFIREIKGNPDFKASHVPDEVPTKEG